METTDTDTEAKIQELEEENQSLRKELSEYRLFVEGLTREENKDVSFSQMKLWNPELVYKMAAGLKSCKKAKRFLFYI